MRPRTDEVLAGLKLYAVGEQRALRSSELAGKLGLPRKIVSNALNWLAVEGKHPQVRRARALKTPFYKYWVQDR